MTETLPDLWAPGVRVVFVGINPSSYAVRMGHYFARKQNRFWPAFSRSRLSLAMRTALGVDELTCVHDVLLPEHGFGLTDLIKRDTPGIAGLVPEDYRQGAPRLKERLTRWGPQVACFHGMTGFRPFVRYGLGESDEGLELGAQTLRLGDIALYCLPNPSPANARYRLQELVAGYDGLAEWLGA